MLAGALIDQKYRLVRELGAGGMGSVWLAHHTVTERPFAIKLLHPQIAASPELRARFVQEAKVAGKLRHPSIVEVFDVGVEPTLGGAPFLVMELLEGVGLDQAIRRLERLRAPLALEIVASVARALEAAHAAGIVHRDLKPANVFLHKSGGGAIVPKVLDFGISKFRSEERAQDHAPNLTQTGSVLGSPMYMSPEQAASDKSIDARSDVHALGVVLWECLVGKPPFVATTHNTLVVEIMTGTRPKLRDALPDATEGVARIVETAFARARDERFMRAAYVADAIDEELARMGLTSTLDKRTAAADLLRAIEAGPAPSAPSRPQLVASPPGLPPASPVADTVHARAAEPAPPPAGTLVSAGATSRAPLKWPWVGVAGSAMIFAAGFALFIGSARKAAAPSTSTIDPATPPAPPDFARVTKSPDPAATPDSPPTIVATLPAADAGAGTHAGGRPGRPPVKPPPPVSK